MTDKRTADEVAALEHDEYHSALEFDDSSGWRIFLVPGAALLFVLGAILMLFLSQGDQEPDPRIAKRLAEQSRTALQAPAATARPAPRPDELPPQPR